MYCFKRILLFPSTSHHSHIIHVGRLGNAISSPAGGARSSDRFWRTVGLSSGKWSTDLCIFLIISCGYFAIPRLIQVFHIFQRSGRPIMLFAMTVLIVLIYMHASQTVTHKQAYVHTNHVSCIVLQINSGTCKQYPKQFKYTLKRSSTFHTWVKVFGKCLLKWRHR